jgi:hypothetical protein
VAHVRNQWAARPHRGAARSEDDGRLGLVPHRHARELERVGGHCRHRLAARLAKAGVAWAVPGLEIREIPREPVERLGHRRAGLEGTHEPARPLVERFAFG